MQQLDLFDLFDLFAAAPPPPRALDSHQRGHVRLPYGAAGLGMPGDIVPAWVCCQCGGVEVTEFTLEINHHCEAFHPNCRGVDPAARWIDLRPHWIPPGDQEEGRDA